MGADGDVFVVSCSSTRDGEGGRGEQQQVCVCVSETGGPGEGVGCGAQQPYLARSLLEGGGVREGEAENSPGCSCKGASMGGVGGCTHGGVDEHLREPLRDTQEVSITLTPMLQVGHRCKAHQIEGRGQSFLGGLVCPRPGVVGGANGGASQPLVSAPRRAEPGSAEASKTQRWGQVEVDFMPRTNNISSKQSIFFLRHSPT